MVFQLVVITNAHLDSTKIQLQFSAGSSPACCVSDICHSEKIAPLEVSLKALRRLTIVQKQIIIIFSINGVNLSKNINVKYKIMLCTTVLDFYTKYGNKGYE